MNRIRQYFQDWNKPVYTAEEFIAHVMGSLIAFTLFVCGVIEILMYFKILE